MSIANGARRLALVVAILALVGAAAAPLIPTGLWWEFSLIADKSLEELYALGPRHELVAVFEMAQRWIRIEDPRDVTDAALLASWLIALAMTIPTVIALLSVSQTLFECAAGRPFSTRAARSFRRFAWASLAAAVAGVLAPTLAAETANALSPAIPEGSAIAFTFEDARNLFSAMLLIVVAHMMVAARRMAEETEAIL